MQGRDRKGRFGSKSESERKVRSIRTTDEVWQKASDIAKELGITRADFYEQMILTYQNDGVIHGKKDNKGVEILEDALKLKANAGGAIKKKIREYLSLY